MATVKVLVQGFTPADAKDVIGQAKTCPTITLVTDGKLNIVVDPGVLDNQNILINALKKENLSVQDINMVCITHAHVDHYRNAGMFPHAKILEYGGVWDGGHLEDWQENFTNDIQILKTPGHDDTSITLFVKTDHGIVAICGDVFLKENGPKFEVNATNPKKLHHSQELVLQLAHWIVPGHGAAYRVKNGQRFAAAHTKATQKPQAQNLGNCKKCHRLLKKTSDACMCQPWLCYHCCECEADCRVCNCKVRK